MIKPYFGFRIARNARISKLSGTKAEQYVFNWKLFTGWDYSIGNAETASNTAMAAVIKLREAINESRSYARRACVPSLWAIRVVSIIKQYLFLKITFILRLQTP
jgi:hypothetical protein